MPMSLPSSFGPLFKSARACLDSPLLSSDLRQASSKSLAKLAEDCISILRGEMEVVALTLLRQLVTLQLGASASQSSASLATSKDVRPSLPRLRSCSLTLSWHPNKAHRNQTLDRFLPLCPFPGLALTSSLLLPLVGRR
jgi:hypothetical protein